MIFPAAPMLSLTELQLQRAIWQTNGWRLVFTNGIFDLLHSGHVSYLAQARALGDILVVGLNSDASTQSLKGPKRPLMPQKERALVLAALRFVDYVTIFETPTAEALVTVLQPEIYVKGGDYAQKATLIPDESRLPEAKVVKSYGGKVVLIPYREGYSTTALIAKIGETFFA